MRTAQIVRQRPTALPVDSRGALRPPAHLDDRGLRAVCVGLGIRRRFTKPGCPWTNGKAERLNRTLLSEFAYAQPWLSNHDRLTALDSWFEHYNSTRPLRPQRPTPGHPTRRVTVNNVPSQYT
jgi:transposase InsO family protein